MIGIILLKPKPNKGIMLVLVILQASTVKRLIGDRVGLETGSPTQPRV